MAYRPPRPGQTTPRMAARQAELAAGAAGRFRVTTRVSPAVLALPQTFTLSISDLKVAERLVDDKFRLMMRDLYESEGASGGRQWAPLSPEYLEKKKIPKWMGIRAGRGALLEEVRLLPAKYRVGLFRLTLGQFKILQLTRRLRLSLTSNNFDHIKETGEAGGKHYIALGTKVDYAIHHWLGSRTTPRRNPIQRTASQDAALGAAVNAGVLAVIERKIALLRRAA